MFRLRASVPVRQLTAGVAGSSTLLWGNSIRHSSTGSKDYYKTLGISKSASKDEIKKAYRKRAMETHPDQGGKKEEFAEVAEAYECLSNAEKRQIYDQYGAEAVNQAGMGGGPGGMGGMGGFGGRRPEDIFSEFFRQAGFGGGAGPGGGAGNGPSQVSPQEVKLRLTLEEIAKGAAKTIRVTRPTTCADCRGNGTKSGQEKPKCSQCHGSGQTVTQHRMGAGMVQQVISQCPRCGGTGTVAKKDDECARCQGAGYRHQAAEINVNIPAGIPSSAILVVTGEGGTMPNAIPGDIHVHIEQAPHAIFTRRGNDLTTVLDITLAESLLGFEKALKLVDGRTVCVKSSPDDGVLKQNSVIKLSGEGMPKGEHGGKGDVYCFVNISTPKHLTREQREALEKAFGKPKFDAHASAGNTVTGRVLRETREQLEEMKMSAWAQQEGGGNGGGRRGPRSRGGGGQGSQAECVQQ